MAELAISIVVGAFFGSLWLAGFVALLYRFGIPVVARDPIKRAEGQRRIGEMSKMRYIVVFGILLYGCVFALGITTATMVSNPHSWQEETMKFVAISVIIGTIQGFRGWRNRHRTERPFPPP